MEVKLWNHQTQLREAPWRWPEVEFFFLIGGYSSGKTFGDIFFIIKLVERYGNVPHKVILASVSLTLLYKTLVSDLVIILRKCGIPYGIDGKNNILRIGLIEFILIGIDNPTEIYAHTVSASIVDEIDELPQDKALLAFQAIQERTRKNFSDGRIPFTVFTTTAQGYRGTYQIIEDLKRAKQKYVKIRGRTADNKANPPSYIKRLEALYTENERMAFLEGHFVNLTAGRVYPEFDASRNVCEPFDIEPNQTVYVGQDLNSGFSKAVAFIIKENILYAVKEWSFPDIGQAPAIIRATFPQNHVLWFPDASAKAIMAGYRQEIGQQEIDMRIGSVNPPVLERIFLFNKLLRVGRLMVFSTLGELTMALKTRQFNRNGEPEKGSGPKAPDHVCDGAEYAIFRVVRSEPVFFDLWEVVNRGK